MIVYLSIGNSDDKLPQRDWSRFVSMVFSVAEASAAHIHGMWLSESSCPFQNACVCVEIQEEEQAGQLRGRLAQVADRFGQESIAWSEAKPTQFITGSDAWRPRSPDTTSSE